MGNFCKHSYIQVYMYSVKATTTHLTKGNLNLHNMLWSAP